MAAQTGGRNGGGAVVTEDGKALIAAFHLLEERLSRVAALFSDAHTPIDPIIMLRSLGMKTSARNAFRCTVAAILHGSVNAEVILHLTDTVTLAATITEESIRDLGIAPGQEIIALVKATFVMLATGGGAPAVSARNRIPGTVAHREDGPISCEITLDIGGGKVLAAVVTRGSADELGLRVGAPAWALFKASHVILAVE